MAESVEDVEEKGLDEEQLVEGMIRNHKWYLKTLDNILSKYDRPYDSSDPGGQVIENVDEEEPLEDEDVYEQEPPEETDCSDEEEVIVLTDSENESDPSQQFEEVTFVKSTMITYVRRKVRQVKQETNWEEDYGRKSELESYHWTGSHYRECTRSYSSNRTYQAHPAIGRCYYTRQTQRYSSPDSCCCPDCL